MSWRNPVIWTEGMFLRPQHFQQQDRHIRGWTEERCGGLRAYSWGVTRLEIDSHQLSLGKFGIKSCAGIFPDGTPFNIPDNHSKPPPLEIQSEDKNQIIELAIPVEKSTGTDVADPDAGVQTLNRYFRQEMPLRDLHTEAVNNEEKIEIGTLATSFRFGSRDKGGYTTIPLARLIERRSDDHVILDEKFIPTCLHCGGSAQLGEILREIRAKLHHRGEELAASLGSPGTGSIGEINGFLLLQIVNRYEPLFDHLVDTSALHPEALYRILVQMGGELSTITSEQRRPGKYPEYNHRELNGSFTDLNRSVQDSLDWALDKPYVAFKLRKHRFGVRTAGIHDKDLIKSAEFILAVKAQMPPEKLQSQFARQTTIAGKDKLKQLVSSHLPGIPIRLMQSAPPEIPRYADFTYFKLDKDHELWASVEESGSIAMFFSGDYPELEIEFLAIKGRSREMG